MPAKDIREDRPVWKLSPGNLLYLARAAGFSSTRKIRGVPEDVVAVAVALGESGGNANAFNGNESTGDNSYGLWQINMLGDLGPERREQFGLASDFELFNPETNAKAAHRVFRDAGNSFRPWSVYKNATYLKHLTAAKTAVPDPNLGEPERHGPGDREWWEEQLIPEIEIDPVLDPIVEPIKKIGELITFLSDSSNWQRVAMFVGGGTLLIIALVSLMGKMGLTPPIGKVGKIAKAVA